MVFGPWSGADRGEEHKAQEKYATYHTMATRRTGENVDQRDADWLA